jgi:hypothetical protein
MGSTSHAGRGGGGKTAAWIVGSLVGGALLVATSGSVHPPGSRLAPLATLFLTSDRCMACHSGVTMQTGEDVSIGFDWRASMMGNSSRDPYWQAAVRREVMDHPAEREEIEDTCATCHMPMARASAVADGRRGSVFDHLSGEAENGEETALAADGVSCSLCHQIQADGLGSAQSFDGGFRVDVTTGPGERSVFGPFAPDAGRLRIMHSASGFRQTEATHLRESEVCATCHTLHTDGLGAAGGQRLPEQMPYVEWRASAFAGQRTCQSCHMPEVVQDVPVTSVMGQARSGVSRHEFLGGNFFMLRMLNRYRDELDVQALPQELERAAARTVVFLQSETARVQVASARVGEGRLIADVAVRNLAGHKLPTAYPSRRAWLHVVVRDAAGGAVFESGAFASDGSIAGNDADLDPGRVEPHYQTVERADQVQIYESAMADAQGRPTTGLLSGVRYLKDNRLLPDGFSAARAGEDAAVRGDATQDADFTGGGDRVRYSVDVAGRRGPFTVDVELWYQPIAYRWARNLAVYDSPETARFARWYDAMASSSGIVLARATQVVPGD